MKKKLCILLICVMASTSLTGCIVGDVLKRVPLPFGHSREEVKDKDDKKDGKKGGKKDEVPEEQDFREDWVELGEDAPEVKEDEEKQDTEIVIVKHPLTCSKDGRQLSEGSYPEIVLSKELKDKYPKLAGVIDSLNDSWKDAIKASVSEYGYYRLQDEFAPEAIYSSEVDAEIVRFDEHLMTIGEGVYDFGGGAHPNHGYYYINIDPVTGIRIEMTNVLADVDAAPGAIAKCLFAQNKDIKEDIESYISYSDENEKIEDVLKKNIHEDSLAWTVSDKGLEIHFSPYEIAPYAIGDIDVTVSYNDYPDLIQQAYRLDKKTDVNSLVTSREEAEESVEPSEDDPGSY